MSEEGVIQGIIDQSTRLQGRDPVIRLYNYIVGGIVPPFGKLLLDTPVATPENIDQYWPALLSNNTLHIKQQQRIKTHVRSNPDIFYRHRGISKSFGGVHALSDVDLTVRCGEVHAVIGENGAGKTTLMNIFGGIIKQDKGKLVFNGEKVDFNSPKEAFRKGISTIHQELTMIPHLSVMENIFMGDLRKFTYSSKGIINHNKLESAAKEALDLIELCIDPHRLVKSLSISEQQELEIIKAVSADSRLIIMDEPNSSLTDPETKRLFDIIDKLKKRGVSIVYVSHKIEEVMQIADRITVLRDGRFAGDLESGEATPARLFSMIAGREKNIEQPRQKNMTGEILLSVRN